MNELVKYEAARNALQAAVTVDEVKDIRDKALAMAAYAKQANDTKLIEWATEIRVRAERRAGEMLAAQKAAGMMNTGARGTGTNQYSAREVRSNETTAPTLADIGVSKDQSSRWQKLAAIPEDKFEQAVSAAKDVAREVTAKAILKATKPAKAPVSAEPAKPVVAPDGTDISDVDIGGDPVEMLAELQKENDTLREQIKVLTADDTKAELHKMILQRDIAVRRQSEAMDQAAMNQKIARHWSNVAVRCTKILGLADRSELIAAVKRLAAMREAA